MKLIKLILILCSFSGFLATAQTTAPQRINYQGVIRNANGMPVPNKNIGLKFHIHELGPGGTVVFTESQSITTNSLGLFSTQIGKVNNLAVVDWLSPPYFLDLLADTAGGTSYIFLGNQQIVSVPYALYAEEAGNVITYSPSPNITITGPSNIIDLSPTLTSTVLVGTPGGLNSTIPKLAIDANGRITSAAEYTANVAGDIQGPLNSQIIVALQGVPLSATTPTTGQVLQFQGTAWTPVTPSISGGAGPWTYVPGNIFPSNNPLMDKVNIGQTSGSSLLNVLNNSGSTLGSSPVVNFSNSNSGFNAQGVLSVTNFSGSGACVYTQNNLAGNNSPGMIINMSNTLSSSAGLNVTHVGQGNAGNFTTTNPSTSADALVASSNSGNATALKVFNSGSGGAMVATNNSPISTAQFNNTGNGSVIYSNSNATSPGIVSYNGGGGVAIQGINTATLANGGAHGVFGQTGNPSSAANGVMGVNTKNGAGVAGINSFTASSSNAFGVYGEVANPSINSSGVFGKSLGAGNGVTGMTGSPATNAAGVFGENTGSGYSFYGLK
ncbi:MAG: hypothetical protein H0W61_13115, partial [Bacteroidetes bacterium]|nr:hypothetical protein [Bacteroidota bacterium]